jgi:dTDP-4-dehydrorhamnose reductase
LIIPAANESDWSTEGPVTKLWDREVLISEDRLPLLVCGIAGVSGYNAFQQFRSKYGDQVFGQRPTRNWPLSGDGIIGCDLEDPDAFGRLLKEKQIKTVLNCGGSCALKACELDPEMAHRVNVFCVQQLLNAINRCGRHDIRLVHLSIDLVFSGTGNGGHVETDVPDPVTVYGATMVAAEQLVIQQRPDAAILRISLPMGISFNGHAGAIDWIQSRFMKHKPATLYFDEIRTPTYCQCLNETIEDVIIRDISGIYHCGGPRPLSLYQIAQIVNRVGGYDPELLIGCPRIDAGPMPPRAGNVTMDSSRLAVAIGRQPFVQWPLKDSQAPDSLDWHFDRTSDAIVGSPRRIVDELYLRPPSQSESTA